MANKRINDLQARSDADATCNVAVDDASQTWRVTLAQIKTFISGITTLGDLPYGGASGAAARLAGNTTATKKVLTQTGTGSVSAAPVWEAPVPALLRYSAKTADYTVTTDDDFVTGDPATAGGTVTFTLPTAVGNAGKIFEFKRIGTAGNKLVIDGSGTQTIDGALTWTMYALNEVVKIVSNGANWLVQYKWPEKHVCILKDLKASGTSPGGSVSGTWTKRDLNDQQGGAGWCSLASSVATLDPGTYELWGSATCYGSDAHQPRLYNTADSALLVAGQSNYVNSAASSIENTSQLLGTFTLTASKTVELQHNVATTKTVTGWGQAASRGITEVFSILRLARDSG